LIGETDWLKIFILYLTNGKKNDILSHRNGDIMSDDDKNNSANLGEQLGKPVDSNNVSLNLE